MLGTVGEVGAGAEDRQDGNALSWLDQEFAGYIEDRRANPRDDVLTDLALATYPDGSTPDVMAVVRTSTFLFAAGQETTARLLASALKELVLHPELQDELRAHHDRIPNFVEETLRYDGPIKGDFRLARVPATVGGVDVPAGSTVMIVAGAANRDPRRFECPAEFRPDRPNARQHLAFGHGIHTCPGAPLARAEARISLERILDRMAGITISATEHGPPGARRYQYAPTYILRGLTQLHLEYTATP
jgi:cytochrome P450